MGRMGRGRGMGRRGMGRGMVTTLPILFLDRGFYLMNFCPNREGLLKSIKKDGNVYLIYKHCGYSKPLNQQSSSYSTTRVIEESKHRTIGVIEEKEELKERAREKAKEASQERISDLMNLLKMENKNE